MKVQEMKTKINEATSGKNTEELTVEFVIDTKKFFIQDIKAGTDTMEINVSRKSYQPTTVESFNSTLTHATDALKVNILNQDDNKSYQIEDLFCGEVFVEFTTQAE